MNKNVSSKNEVFGGTRQSYKYMSRPDYPTNFSLIAFATASDLELI